MTDKKGALVWRVDHRPFGEASVDEDPDGDGTQVTLNLRFPGQYFDKETGLHYNYFRDYHPGIGRYLEPDPIGLFASPILFGYCVNNPIRLIDPQGLVEICLPWFSQKAKWEEIWSTEKWTLTGTQVFVVGVSGVCHWRKTREGARKREVTPRKLCWDSCEPKKIYPKNEAPVVQRERFEIVIDTDNTPMRWVLPIDGFAWIYECDRNFRSPFLPNKD